MVSFWPFKGDDNSAASFEKTLSQLSSKIKKASSTNDALRQHQRRYKALWTLYTVFAYILTAAILTLVTGVHKWRAGEYTAMAGGPVLIYGVRLGLDAYYNYRIARSEEYLSGLTKQRDQAIEKLKAATKYNSTQQLLDKYGGSPRRGTSPGRQAGGAKGKGQKQTKEGAQRQQQQQQGMRTGVAPPPTANIPGRGPPSGAVPPNGAPQGGQLKPPQPPGSDIPGEEFAPNAFSLPPPPSSSRPQHQRQQSTQYATEGPKWYDRLMDVVLGEDEAQARNRIALICQNCRLVNGQAPPGARTLEDVGKWRCSACHAMNGVESEASKVIRQVSGEGPMSPVTPVTPASPQAGDADVNEEEIVSSEDAADDGEAADDDAEAGDTPPAGATRSKARQRKKA